MAQHVGAFASPSPNEKLVDSYVQYDEGLEVALDQHQHQPGLEYHDTRNAEKIPLSPNGTSRPPVPEKNGWKGFSELHQEHGNGVHNGHYGPGMGSAPAYNDHNHGTTSTAYANTPPSQPPQNRICGLRRRIFWALVAAAVLIVVAAVVGGAVGATQSNKSSSSNSNSGAAAETSGAATSTRSAKSSSSSASATKTQKVAAITTSTLITLPSATLISDCPSANGTLFKVKKGGKTYNYRILCGAAILNINDPTAAVTNNQDSLNNCIKQCALNVPKGASCDAVCWRQRTNPNDEATIGSCFGYETSNTTQGTFSGDLSGNSYCDGAVFIGTGDNWADAY
ncbi:MAG: hypothetical protein MMC23_008844 [Stictis urceolatum]|nr:hypothetical protein [Stictis urceolata]